MHNTKANRTDLPKLANACRDRELVRYVGRHSVVTLGHVMEAMDAGRSVTYERVARCIERGLLERATVLRSEPALLRATRAGISFAGLGLPVASFAPGKVDHYLRCADVAAFFARKVGPGCVFTEPEIPLIEAIEGELFASAELGAVGTPERRLHRADLAVISEGKRVAVEVELTPKSQKRLRTLLSAWRRAIALGTITEVQYLCRPGKTYRAVKRAAETIKADVIVIREGVPR